MYLYIDGNFYAKVYSTDDELIMFDGRMVESAGCDFAIENHLEKIPHESIVGASKYRRSEEKKWRLSLEFVKMEN